MKNRFSSFYEALPGRSDPRWRFSFLLASYLFVGINFLGFNREPLQLIVTLVSTVFLDWFFNFIFKKEKYFIPLSGLISALSLCILLNYSRGIGYSLIPVFLTVASKYVITFSGRHIFNPSLFGVAASLLISDGFISSASPYQWGNTWVASIFVVTAALLIFVSQIKRTALIVSFLFFYFIAAGLRAYFVRWMIPPETLFFSLLASPAFYLFTFFMLTDPGTSPRSRKEQVLMSFAIALGDFVLNYYQILSSFFLSGFFYFTVRFIVLHLGSGFEIKNIVLGVRRALLVSLFFALGLAGFSFWGQVKSDKNFGFQLKALENSFYTERGDLLDQLDPRLSNVAKWLVSIGDAVAVADVDNDGRQDIFFTNTLKRPEDRGSLYRNMGGMNFEKIEVEPLKEMKENPKQEGAMTGALWFDYDNDGDQDLLVLAGFGETKLLQNQLMEKGKLFFENVSKKIGISPYTNSVTANVLDFNNDGRLDILIGNVYPIYLSGYEKQKKFNGFSMPPPEYRGDERMFNIMHRGWYNANNGGESLLFLNSSEKFLQQDNKKIGLTSRRWTLDIGVGDLDKDGWTDLYFANDFGPDELYLNENGKKLVEIKGHMVGQLGRDTYKGMNATITDFDGNLFPDIYVSNMHHKLQAEGSMLWMNSGEVREKGYKSFSNEAVKKNILNEKRFGWGAASGDLNRDGKIDIVQANGYLDDKYDKKYGECPDYWYWNTLIGASPPHIHGFSHLWANLQGRCLFPDEKNRVYLNLGERFVDISEQVGMSIKNTARGVALADFDNDGDLDVVMTRMTDSPIIYENKVQNSNSWIGLSLQGNGIQCNRNAFGSKVIVRGEKIKPQYREAKASNGLSAQSDMRLFFGLEKEIDEVSITIEWCGQKKEELVLKTNRYHSISQDTF